MRNTGQRIILKTAKPSSQGTLLEIDAKVRGTGALSIKREREASDIEWRH